MAFKNLPTELTVPADATTGTARIIITKNIPPELVATPPVGSFVSVILFMSTSDNTYAFMGVTSAGEYSQGYCQAGSVEYLGAMTSDQMYLTSTLYQDVNDFSTRGIWQTITTFNGWSSPAGVAVLSWRFVPSPANTIQIAGRITGGTTTSGIKVGSLPNTPSPIPRPINDIQFGVTNNTNGTVVTGALAKNGDINIFGTFSGDLSFDCLVLLDL